MPEVTPKDRERSAQLREARRRLASTPTPASRPYETGYFRALTQAEFDAAAKAEKPKGDA